MKTTKNNTIADYVTLIEAELEQLIPEQNTPYQTLFQAARYSLLNGGKRLRPVLTLATTEVCQGPLQHAIRPACALEMVHTYSLIHDDLPCMDNDDFRRGKPSLHRAFPEGQAVLAGDFLLTYAFDIIANDPNLEANQKVELIAVLSKRAGAHGMIGGQVMDMEAEGKKISLNSLQSIHRKKTGAMITGSIEFGAIIANTSAEIRQTLCSFGDDIGLAFQIIDDVLDVTESEKKHGKIVASDITNQKSTYVSFLGVNEAKRMAEQLLASGLSKLRHLPYDVSPLEELAVKFIHRNF